MLAGISRTFDGPIHEGDEREIAIVEGRGQGSGREKRESPNQRRNSRQDVTTIAPRALSTSASCPRRDSADLQDPSIKKPAQARKLSTRAENVLKILAVELTGEEPPRGRSVPSELLLQRLSYKHLAAARNCGPQTTAEIIEWAQGRGTDIRLSFPAGKSFSAMWQHVIAKCSTGEFSKAEIADALETSTRRRNTRIPVALQKILLQFIRSSNE